MIEDRALKEEFWKEHPQNVQGSSLMKDLPYSVCLEARSAQHTFWVLSQDAGGRELPSVNSSWSSFELQSLSNPNPLDLLGWLRLPVSRGEEGNILDMDSC